MQNRTLTLTHRKYLNIGVVPALLPVALTILLPVASNELLPVAMSYAKRWCFTLNNYTDEDVNHIKEVFHSQNCVFAVVGIEIGENGTPHLQGFVHLRNKKTFKSLKLILPSAHIELARGTDVENQNYCKKDNNVLLEIGLPAVSQETNHSLLDAYNLVDKVVNGEDLCDLLDSSEIFKIAYGKHQRLVDTLIHKKSKRKLESMFLIYYKKINIVFHKWQADLYSELMTEPDARRIMWYIDPAGGSGKSTFAAVFISRMTRDVVRYGFVKPSDMALSYKGERVVFFDLARASYDWLPLCALMEEIKNGEVFSGKYESCTKRFQPPHVVVFANFGPPGCAFSHDRVDLRFLNIKHKVCNTYE